MKGFISLILAFLLSVFFSGVCIATTLSGNIDKEDFLENSSVVVDGLTGNPVPDAEISIPTQGFFARTNHWGQFKLDASMKSPVILSVKADGYKPFSLTVNESQTKKPLTIVITKLFNNEIVIDSQLHHLGDDKFSHSSANVDDFRLKSEGPYFFKEFYIENLSSKNAPVLNLGSIIGLDTPMAKRLFQSKVASSASSPLKVYLNSQKIGEIKINGDNQEIPLPKNILRSNAYNTIRIETGTNQSSVSYVDYDDMEFMNLILTLK